MRGAQKICGNSETSEDRFDGVLPVADDWHAKLCFMEVSEGLVTVVHAGVYMYQIVHQLIIKYPGMLFV